MCSRSLSSRSDPSGVSATVARHLSQIETWVPWSEALRMNFEGVKSFMEVSGSHSYMLVAKECDDSVVGALAALL